MRIPTTTYRIQFNPAFGFADAHKIVPYLAELGISDLYASPIFAARAGSTHGYDVVDPNQLNPELGTEAEFDSLVEALHQQEMGWLQDIVPNHMAYDSQNHMLMDVLEHGPNSEYFDYFDIGWEHPYEDIKGRVLAPLLGNFYSDCLENGEIQLQYEENGFTANYYSLKIPIRIESYAGLITYELGRLAQSLGRKHPDFIKLLGVLYMVKNIASEAPAGKPRQDQVTFIKSILWELYCDNEEIERFIHRNLEIFNGEVGKPESFNLLDDLLCDQFFRLSFWKVGAEELNYRRFFTVNELICLRAEDLKVFRATHDLICSLVKSGKINHLRIDHIDGLYDPARYLQRLKERLGDIYIVVEKILELEEEALPTHWPIQGTSGYEYLNYVNSLFCQPSNQQRFSEIYSKFISFNPSYEQLFTDKKRLIADKNLAGDAENLARLLKQIAGQYRYGRDFTLNGLKKAILEVLVLFPVYRTYINSEGMDEGDRHYVQQVIRKAKGQIPQLVNELNFIEKVLLLNYEETLTEEDQGRWLHFVMKMQQFSGPLMAKGIEDTLFYVYNRLVSLNEVGGDPSKFGIPAAAFHRFNQQQLQQWPHAMNATATHDTKRSEDIRARLNIISEMPDQWEAEVMIWQDINRPFKEYASGQAAPSDNDEYFLYQTLLGAFPFDDREYDTFVQRIKDYVIKAVREAKIRTAWLRPDTDYEEGFIEFVEQILKPGPENLFLEKFRPFQQKIAHYGLFNSLSQVLLKITSPGVPDIYQGTELWDLSLVDPDNRRPVDFEQRTALLRSLKQQAQQDILGLVQNLTQTWQDGRIKLFLIARALQTRNQYLQVFQKGEYIPLEVSGAYHEHVVAFARQYEQTVAIAIVPRFLTGLIEPGAFPCGEAVWKDTRLELPSGLRDIWQNKLTEQSLPAGDTLSVGQALAHFPVALLVSQSS